MPVHHQIPLDKMKPAEQGKICTRRVSSSDDLGKTGSYTCGKPAVWSYGEQHFCQHHSLKGRFVFRDGDTGTIVARFDTEEELKARKEKYAGMRMQMVTKSKRRDIV